MSKIVLVETVSTFRHMYAVEIKDEDPIEYALDDITAHVSFDVLGLEEFAQNHVDESVFSYREITEDDYLKIFDKENDYLKEWTPELKKRYIYKPK